MLKKRFTFLLALFFCFSCTKHAAPFLLPTLLSPTTILIGVLGLWRIYPSVKLWFFSRESERVLGHNPNISEIPPVDATKTDHNDNEKIPVITALGLNDPEGMYAGKFDTATTFTVICRFHDTALRGSNNPLTFIDAIRAINVGQQNDGKTLLYVVIRCFMMGYKKVHLFSNSRGGAAVITMLDMLSNPQKYLEFWQSVSITDYETQEKIRQMVARGIIYCAHPIMEFHKTIQRIVQTKSTATQNFLNSFCSYLGTPGSYISHALNNTVIPTLQYVAYHVVHFGLRVCTDYDYHAQDPISIIMSNIEKDLWPYRLTIALAEEDEVVTNDHDEYLLGLSRKHPHKLSIENGGKHHRDIRRLLHRFRRYICDENSLPKTQKPDADFGSEQTNQTQQHIGSP